MLLKGKRPVSPVDRELALVEKQEKKLSAAAEKRAGAKWKDCLEAKVPGRIYTALDGAFCKGFALVFDKGSAIIELVFDKGSAIIEKSYAVDKITADYSIRDYAFQVKGGRRELRQIHKGARQSGLLNMAMTTAEGIGLGALGIGLPDIVLFLGTLLRGVYETALSYGFDYKSDFEKLLILKMLAASLSSGEDYERRNREVDELLLSPKSETESGELEKQIEVTSSAFAMDMLLLKFIQGLPIVGIIGGAANPVYYRRVMSYVQLKYRKRYLIGKKGF